jgi:hypothetical protein
MLSASSASLALRRRRSLASLGMTPRVGKRRVDDPSIRSDRELERLDDPVVVLDAISDATNCRFASSHRTVVPASPVTCNTGGSESKSRFCAPFSLEK